MVLLWMAQEPTQKPWTFMGLSSGATQCLPAGRAETNCRSQDASKIPTMSWSTHHAEASSLLSRSQSPPHPHLCSEICIRSKTSHRGRLLWTLSWLWARAGLPDEKRPCMLGWIGGLQGLRRGTSAQPWSRLGT